MHAKCKYKINHNKLHIIHYKHIMLRCEYKINYGYVLIHYAHYKFIT